MKEPSVTSWYQPQVAPLGQGFASFFRLQTRHQRSYTHTRHRNTTENEPHNTPQVTPTLPLPCPAPYSTTQQQQTHPPIHTQRQVVRVSSTLLFRAATVWLALSYCQTPSNTKIEHTSAWEVTGQSHQKYLPKARINHNGSCKPHHLHGACAERVWDTA